MSTVVSYAPNGTGQRESGELALLPALMDGVAETERRVINVRGRKMRMPAVRVLGRPAGGKETLVVRHGDAGQ